MLEALATVSYPHIAIAIDVEASVLDGKTIVIEIGISVATIADLHYKRSSDHYKNNKCLR